MTPVLGHMWYDIGWYAACSAILAAMLLDRLGEPPNRFHPTAWMGSVVAALIPVYSTTWWGVITTIACCALAAVPALLMYWVLPAAWPGGVGIMIYWALTIPLLKSALSMRGMEEHAMAIYYSLNANDGGAAGRLACIVKRKTAGMNATQICSGTIESIAENTVDGITGTLFYTGLAGLPGALVYRTVSTIDSMAGYRSEIFRDVGRFGAGCDTLLNWIPARMTGYVMVASAVILRYDWQNAYRAVRRDAKKADSVNSGYAMAATAGALGVRLAKPHHYALGDGRDPRPDDIQRAIRMMKCTVWLFVGAACIMAAIMSILAGVIYDGLF